LQGFLSEFPASRFADQARDKIFALQVGGQTGPIRSQRDLVAAILFLVVGAAASWQGSALTMSTETGIGPGFLPRLVAAALIVLGLLSLIRAFTVRTLPIGDIAWRKVGATMAALALFAVLYQGAGLVAAVLACTLLSTAAAARFHWPTSIGVTALATVAAVLLVKALQLPAPLFGPWLGS
jgi:putative tricarboxylic transport membrane protein